MSETPRETRTRCEKCWGKGFIGGNPYPCDNCFGMGTLAPDSSPPPAPSPATTPEAGYNCLACHGYVSEGECPRCFPSRAPSAPPAPAPASEQQEQDQLQEGSTMKSASPNQPQVQVLSRDAGRVLDAAIAEKVFGYPVTWLPTALLPSAPHYQNSAEGSGWLYCRHYSTDIGAAWQVVAHVQTRHPGWRFSLLGGDVSFGYAYKGRGPDSYVADKTRREAFGWRASFFGDEDPTKNYGDRHADEWGETPALAICRAALSAQEPEPKE